jgi:hypothetical protein
MVYIKYKHKQGQLSWYSDSLQAGRSGDQIPVVARFSAPVQTGPGSQLASCTMGTGSFTGVKRQGRGIDHPPPSIILCEQRKELCSNWQWCGSVTTHVNMAKNFQVPQEIGINWDALTISMLWTLLNATGGTHWKMCCWIKNCHLNNCCGLYERTLCTTVEFIRLTVIGSMILQSHIIGWMHITVQLTSLLVTENTCL